MIRLRFVVESLPFSHDRNIGDVRSECRTILNRCFRKAGPTVQLLDRRLGGVMGVAENSVEFALLMEAIVDVVRHYPEDRWEIGGTGGIERRQRDFDDFPDVRSYPLSTRVQYAEFIVANYYVEIQAATEDGVRSHRRATAGEAGIRLELDPLSVTRLRTVSLGADYEEPPAPVPVPAPKAPEPELPPIRESRRLSFKRKQ